MSSKAAAADAALLILSVVARLADGENPYSVLASAAVEGSELLRLASGPEETGEG